MDPYNNNNHKNHTKALHKPVMLCEAMSYLDPQPNETIVDGTFGAGGYTRAILGRGVQQLIGIDKDYEAFLIGSQLMMDATEFKMVHGSFCNLPEHLKELNISRIDGLVLDVGVSSLQIRNAARGFSFMQDGPLDMRMGTFGQTAADIVNEYSENKLADIFYRFGEERRSRAVSKAIINARRKKSITSTLELAHIAESVIGNCAERRKTHPATRIFQALRIAVNDELNELEAVLRSTEQIMNPGGRIVIITFHSLEDRIVKQFFDKRSKPRKSSRHEPNIEVIPTLYLMTKKVHKPSMEEVKRNPGARSAKLRAASKI